MSKGCVVLIYGQTGAGKTFLSDSIKNSLNIKNLVQIDADDLRSKIKSYNFSKESRIEHLKRVVYFASKFEELGYVTLVSVICPYEEIRILAKELSKNLISVYVNTDLETRKNRDSKGLYSKGLVDESSFEIPENPEFSFSMKTENDSKIAVKEITDKIWKL